MDESAEWKIYKDNMRHYVFSGHLGVMNKKLIDLLKVTETDCTSEYVQRSQKRHRFILFQASKEF